MAKVAVAETYASRLFGACPARLSLFLFYGAYIIAGGFGQGLALIPGIVITFWPPAGIFLAMLLLNEKSTWPWWVLVACVAELSCNAIWFHNPVAFALVYFIANALEALTAAWLIRRFINGPFTLETLTEVAAFVVLGAIVAPVVGASIIATTDVLLGKYHFFTSWPLVWLGDSTGLLLATPLALGVVQMWRERTEMPKARIIEAAIVSVVLVVASALSFRGQLATAFLTLPALLWAAARFQLRGAALALALIALMESMFAASAVNALAADPLAMKQYIIVLQMFFGIATVSALIVAALSQSHQKALHAAHAAKAELEQRIAERTADLQASERFSRSTLEASPDCLKVISPDGKLELMNANGCRQMEIDDFGLCEGLPWDLQWPENARQPISNALERAQAGQDSRFEAFCPTAKGTPKWWDVAVTPVLDEQGTCTRILSVSRDITERKQTEEKLARSQASLTLAMKAAHVYSWEVNIAEGQVVWSDNAAEVLGFSPDLMPKTVAETMAIMHPDDTLRVQDHLQKILSGEERVFSLEYRFVHPVNGSVTWVHTDGTSENFKGDKPERIVGLSQNITARKQAEQLVRESEKRFRVTFDNAAIGMTHTTPEGKWLRVNDAFTNMTGYSRQELLKGMSFSDISHPQDLQTDVELLAELLAGSRQFYTLDKRYSLKQGRILHVSIAVSLVRREDGTPDYLISSVQDISERTRQEQRQKLLMNELNHRVKNTLAMVQSMASQTLRNSSSLSDAKTRFEGRLMALSKAHDVLTRESWESAPLLDVVEKALVPYHGENGKRFDFGGPDVRVPPHYALAISMALHELCTNAVKYGSLSNDKGTVQFRWTISGQKARKLKIQWKEKGGPSVETPKSRGFGSRLIERGLASDLGGEVKIGYGRAGVTCSIVTTLDK